MEIGLVFSKFLHKISISYCRVRLVILFRMVQFTLEFALDNYLITWSKEGVQAKQGRQQENLCRRLD